jgi:nitroimidazol reductase NimA-like FMN-containing flavoprotein (pyridoxamine 5'-phosphate oxidase superfamily)
MKQIFEIKDKVIIHSVLDRVEYGTLALSVDSVPYAVPVNFVRVEDDIYFHGALSNKKMKILAKNPRVSFSVVEEYSLIASFFSSTEGLACPASQFFKSVSIEGDVEIVNARDEKAMMFEALMKKLLPEGGYKPFLDEAYDKAIKATAVMKIIPTETRAKFKLGQHLDDERFAMIVKHLKERGTKTDRETVALMKEFRP